MHLRSSAHLVAGRVRAGLWPSVQCGLAASLAWSFSVQVLDHPRPFFAAVAAVVALGVAGGGRLRRTAELALGVALGVAVGDLLVHLIGQGAWQIGVVVTAALLLALSVGGTGLAVIQAGLQAVFVVALPRTADGGLHRWQDALVGGAAALLIAALLPTDPWREARGRRSAYVAGLADVLRASAQAARDRSVSAAGDALAKGRALEPDLNAWELALEAGRETARLSLLRRGNQQEWDEARAFAGAITRATRNLRVLVRRVLTTTEFGLVLAPALPDLMDEAAEAIALLDGGDALPALRAVAAKLDPHVLGATSLPDQVVVGQLRVAVADLLMGLGVPYAEALRSFPELQS